MSKVRPKKNVWRRAILLIAGVVILAGVGLISDRWDDLSVRYGDFAYAGEGDDGASAPDDGGDREPADDGGEK